MGVGLQLQLTVLVLCVAGRLAVEPPAGQPAPPLVSAAYLDRLLREYGDGAELSRAGLQRLLAALGVTEHSHSHSHSHSQRQPADHESGLAPGDGHGHRDGHGPEDRHDHGPEDGHDRGLEDGHNHGQEHHDHGPEDHDHGPEDNYDHGPEDHDHGPEDHDHGPEDNHDHGAADHGSGGHHDHGPEDHDHGPEDDHDHGPEGHHSPAGRPKRTAVARLTRQADLQDEVSPDVIDGTREETCPSAVQLLSEFGLAPESPVDADALSLLCPSLVYHAVAGTCPGRPTDRAERHRPPADRPGIPHLQLWLFASLAVLAISLCGLAGVAVVPIMQRVVYRQLLQFLVALAVGTLAGDALLHLLPHALAPHASHSDDAHEHGEHTEHLDAVLKGLVALLSLMFFFLAERGIGILHATCTKAKDEKINKRLADMTGLDKETTEMIEKKINNYRHSTGANHCFGDQDTMDVLARLNDSHDDSCPDDGPEDGDAENHNLTPDCSSQPLAPGAVGCSQPSSSAQQEQQPSAHSHLKVPAEQRVRAAGSASSSAEPASRGTRAATDEPCERFSAQERVARSSDFTVIIHEHEHRHHGHTHTHGHIHQPAGSSAAAVAGMVIVGDGLHNFTDGMAIGAAFSAGLASGLSTSVAVFCHELPHEVGDFAVLLQSGMSVRQALFYNVVSSVLCFLGMILGMLLGNMESFSAWVFSAAAGSFLYIALVDMVPELTAGSGDADSSPCRHLSLQLAGMICGAGIMLAIAVYESDLHSLITVI